MMIAPRPRPHRHRWSAVGFITVLLVGTVGAIAFAAPPAAALCLRSPLEGGWRNIDANTRSITRAEIRIACHDQELCGVDDDGTVSCSDPAPPDTIELWGRCHPTDCVWGRRNLTLTHQMWRGTIYEPGFARITVWVRSAPAGTEARVEVWMHTHFTDNSGRADYTSDDFLRRP